MTDHSFPTLGFDPAPGNVGDVDSLVSSLTAARNTLGDASSLLHRLNSSTDGTWTGQAADKFREKVSEDVPKALAHAHDSFDKAVKALSGWSGDLTTYQTRARELERQAAAAKKNVDAAQSHLASVKANPYHVEGQSTPALVQEAKTKQSSAESAASSGVSSAQNELDDIIRQARTLQSDHHGTAHTVAQSLKSAPDHLAPEEPGFWDSIGSWISDHAKEIGDVLSDISAVTGFLALVTPPPFDAAFLAVSVISSLGALGFHAASGASGWTLAGDIVGAVPGISVLKEAATGVRAAETVTDGVRMARSATSLGDTAFGVRYAASGVTDTLRAAPRAASDILEETRVLGSNASRTLVNAVNRVPGVAISDGLTAAARIDKAVAGTLGTVGAADLAHRATHGGEGIDEGTKAPFDYGGLGYGGFGSVRDLGEMLHVLPTVQIR